MSTRENLIENLRELLGATNPGLVTQEDLRAVERRIDEIEELVDELEERLAARAGGPPAEDEGEDEGG